MFENFEERTFRLQDTTIYALIGGSGPPLVLLHGYPQTRRAMASWRVLPKGRTTAVSSASSITQGSHRMSSCRVPRQNQ